MELHVVAYPTSGYAREDAGSVAVLGAYTDSVVATKVRSLWGVGATVTTIEVDAIPPGIAKAAEEFGVRLTSKEPG